MPPAEARRPQTEGAGETPLRWDTTDAPSAFDPVDWFSYCEALQGRSTPRLPANAVQSVINAPAEHVHLDIVRERYSAQPDGFATSGHPFSIFRHKTMDVAVAASAKGSYAVGGLDELVVLGARRVVILNLAAGVSADASQGSFMIPIRALRDDGVSHHYLPESRYVSASPILVAALESAAAEMNCSVRSGAIWTNPAHFRVSLPRLRAFRDEGCIAMDNELATEFAAGRSREVEVAALTYIAVSMSTDCFATPGAGSLFGRAEAALQLNIALEALHQLDSTDAPQSAS